MIRPFAWLLCVTVFAVGGYIGVVTAIASSSATHGATVVAANSPPSVSAVILNNGNSITLLPAATTSVAVNFTVQDLDGCGNVFSSGSIAVVLYRSGAGSSCAASSSNCYQGFSLSQSCTGTSTSANATATLTLQYFAQATDASSSYPSENWIAAVTATDGSSTTSTATSTGVELNTLLSIDGGTYYSLENYAQSATDTIFGVSTYPWHSVSNATFAPDSLYATDSTSGSDYTNYLKGYNFGFSISTSSILRSVTASVFRHNASGTPLDIDPELGGSGFSVTSTPVTWSSSDTWDAFSFPAFSVTPTNLNQSSTYFRFHAYNSDPLNPQRLFVDSMKLGVTYLIPSVDFGTVSANATSTAVLTKLANQGNTTTTLRVHGADLTYGSGTIPVASIEYATSSFSWAAAGFPTLSTSATAVSGLSAPPNGADQSLYWALKVPNGTPTGMYAGTITYTSVWAP